MRCGFLLTRKKKMMIYSAAPPHRLNDVPLKAIWEAFSILLSPFFLLIPRPCIYISRHIKAHTYGNHLWFCISILHLLLLYVKWQEVTGKGSDKGMSVRESQAECERAPLAGWTGNLSTRDNAWWMMSSPKAPRSRKCGSILIRIWIG